MTIKPISYSFLFFTFFFCTLAIGQDDFALKKTKFTSLFEHFSMRREDFGYVSTEKPSKNDKMRPWNLQNGYDGWSKVKYGMSDHKGRFDIIKNGKLYLKSNNSLFEGNIIGKLKVKVLKGFFEGECKTYYDSGELKEKYNYLSSKIEGYSPTDFLVNLSWKKLRFISMTIYVLEQFRLFFSG